MSLIGSGVTAGVKAALSLDVRLEKYHLGGNLLLSWRQQQKAVQ